MSQQWSVRSLRRAWSSLPAPELTELAGDLEAGFVAPLTRVAPLGLSLLGLPRWYGKRMTAEGKQLNGVNLVRPRWADRKVALQERLPMLADQSVSLADGLPVVAITYASDAPIPWRWVRDEVRWLSDDTFAAMSYVDLPGIRRLGGLPFLLKRQRSPAARSAHRG